MKTRKIILTMLAVSFMSLPMFAAQMSGWGEFRFNGAKKQAFSFKQRAFSVTDNLWNRDAKQAAETIGESADQVELFIGRIGESGDTKGQKRREAGQQNAMNKAGNLKKAGITLLAVGGGMTALGIGLVAGLSCLFVIYGLACLPVLIIGLGILGAGGGCFGYAIKLGA